MTTNQNGEMTFREAIEYGGSLDQTLDGVRISYIHNAKLLNKEFTNADIANVDPRLPRVLAAMFDAVKVNDIPILTIYSSWVINTLSIWENPLAIVDIHNETHYVQDLMAFLDGSETTDILKISGSGYPLYHVDGIPYVKHTAWITLEVTPAELDKHFPGWEIRYDLLSALGSSKDEIYKSVFTRESTYQDIPPSIAKITFE